jgi:hypothetical protein
MNATFSEKFDTIRNRRMKIHAGPWGNWAMAWQCRPSLNHPSGTFKDGVPENDWQLPQNRG